MFIPTLALPPTNYKFEFVSSTAHNNYYIKVYRKGKSLGNVKSFYFSVLVDTMVFHGRVWNAMASHGLL